MRIMPVSLLGVKKCPLKKVNFASRNPFGFDFNQEKPKYDIANDYVSYMAFQEFMKSQNENNDEFDSDEIDEELSEDGYNPYFP